MVSFSFYPLCIFFIHVFLYYYFPLPSLLNIFRFSVIPIICSLLYFFPVVLFPFLFLLFVLSSSSFSTSSRDFSSFFPYINFLLVHLSSSYSSSFSSSYTSFSYTSSLSSTRYPRLGKVENLVSHCYSSEAFLGNNNINRDFQEKRAKEIDRGRQPPIL